VKLFVVTLVVIGYLQVGTFKVVNAQEIDDTLTNPLGVAWGFAPVILTFRGIGDNISAWKCRDLPRMMLILLNQEDL
jgi:hypothetical protein